MMASAKNEARTQGPRHSPTARELAFIAALVAPNESRIAPAEAAKTAARLWHAARACAGDYAAALAKGDDVVEKYLAAADLSFAKWWEAYTPREMLKFGTEKDSPLRDFINADLPKNLKVKTVQTLRRIFASEAVDDAVGKDSAEIFAGMRKDMETLRRVQRRRRPKKAGLEKS